MPYGYSLTETTTEWGNDFFEGFSISPNIALSTDFIIKMKTNRNALCKTSFIPQLPFYNIYSKLIDDPFKTEQIDNTNYQIKVNVGSANMLKKRLLKMVGYNNLLEVAYSYVTKEDVKEDALELISYKTDSLLQSLDFEREKRSKFQYQMDEQAKQGKAVTSLERAKGFVFEMKKLL